MSNINDEIIVNKFTEEAAKAFRKQVVDRAMQDSNMPIVIYIDSYGGYLDSLNMMLETIEQVHNPIITVCIGKAMSCGAVLLAAGDHRFCGRNSRVMIHQGSSGAQGPIESLQNDVAESKRINKQFMTWMSKRCGMSLKVFKEEMKKRSGKGDDEARDLYLPAQAAVELGIVEFVGMPLIKPVVMYQIEASKEKKYETVNSTTDKTLKSMGLKKSTKKKTTRKKKTTKKKVTRKKR
jgi:ATP-dependent Clp protease protease subunit